MSTLTLHLEDTVDRQFAEALIRNSNGWIGELGVGTGWLPQPEDERDYKFSAIINGEYVPESSVQPAATSFGGVTSIDKEFIPAVQDQYYQGACVGFAIASGIGTIARADPRTDWQTDYSPQWLYNLARKAIGELHLDDGSYIRDAVKAAATHGVARESDFPYYRYQDVQEVDPLTNEKWVKSAKSFKLGEYRQCMNLAEVKAAIKAGYPVVFGFLCYQNLNQAWSNGRIPLPSGSVTGGHAVLAVQDDEPNRFISGPNSWGREWGADQVNPGWFHIPYGFFEQGKCSDMWALIGESAETYHPGPNAGRSQ